MKVTGGIRLKRVDDNFRLHAVSERGDELYTDGSSAIGAAEDGWRPTELLLVSLAGCSSIDIINVLKKQRQRIDDFEVEMTGLRPEAVPAPFHKITMHMRLKGKIKEEKIQKAIELTKGKYCSVYFSLDPKIEVEYTYALDYVEDQKATI